MFDERKHPRDADGKFTDGNGGNDRADKLATAVKKYSDTPKEDLESMGVRKKKTAAEKIASVHIDFDKDNILPELNEEDLEKVGAKSNKPVLLKKSIIDRNKLLHDDLTDSDFEKIVANALYAPSEVFPANKDKPYYHFAKVIEVNSKGKPQIGLVLLDVDDKKDAFEIVHAHFVRPRSYETLKRKK